MDTAFILLLTLFVVWQLLRSRYQRERITFLGQRLAGLQLERHMETLTTGYARAIHEQDESRQLQILETFAPAERAAAAQIQTLADAMQKADAQETAMGPFSFCLPYAERFVPVRMRDFRELLQIHAKGLRHAADNDSQWDPKTRAFHLSAELYLFQHSCHWFCKSRVVADARLQVRHQLTHQKVVDSVSEPTRLRYLQWLNGDA
ncbi:hypothetical protein IMZ29_14725 [Achromobacter sp. GG226]|uniref:hypothetical protein n=1 Tax=Verticiella alkaliphila TaxID=2779529 RepID=UPI001C0B1F11|nr:hypothetical protein [Verticiella sp. GG226]MBU4611741.1 hypothetical protein [Verticiella sp. GG226]